MFLAGTKVPVCSGGLYSALRPGKPAVWHTSIIGKTQFTAEPIGPAGQPVSGWRAAFLSGGIPICRCFPAGWYCHACNECSHYWKWGMSSKKQKSVVIPG